MPEEVLVVLTTWPDLAQARIAGQTLVEEQLAACANLLPNVESIYRWEGSVQRASEVLVIFKTTIGKYRTLEARLQTLHSYSVPEIVCLEVRDGLPAYLQWVLDAC